MARLLSVNFNTSSGRDSSPWVLDGWAKITTMADIELQKYTEVTDRSEMITMCNNGLTVRRAKPPNAKK